LELIAEALVASEAPAQAAAAPVETAIDLAHLARMTLGDVRLEAEVLMLFERQAAVLLARMRDATPAASAAFAHTLKGSARGIGAWGVAAAAETIESSAERPDANATALARLAAAVDAARAEIALRLQHREREE
jgi:HPt (histidine-containing phosphotransfer) domain-containing protein